MKRISKDLSIHQQPIRVHAISTGSLSIKKKAVNVKRPGVLSTLGSFPTKEFAPMMPVWNWVVEHPEGNFLIDLGLSSEVLEPDYFKPLGAFMNYYFSTQMKFEIQREDELDVQLKEIGLSPQEIDRIILTHLHIDHTGCMKHFPQHEIEVNKLEHQKAKGVFPQLFPDTFRPKYLELDQPPQIFGSCKPLTQSGDILLLPSPGHTFGHSSVLLKTDQGELLFAGDLVYNEEQLAGTRFSATLASKELARDTIRKVKMYARSHKLVFLPTHDPEADRKLEEMIFLEG